MRSTERRRDWTRVVNFDALVGEAMISPEERTIFSFVDSAEEAWAVLVKGGLTIPPPRGAEPRPDVAR